MGTSISPYLDVQLMDFGEEASDSIVCPAVVKQHQLCSSGGQKRGYVLLVELVHDAKVSEG